MTAQPTSNANVPFGQRLRDWWNSRSRFEQWACIIPVVVFVYLLPYLNFFPLSTEPWTDYELALFNAARLGLIALGLNVVLGQAGLLDLGYVGFFAIGAYVAAIMTSPDSFLDNPDYSWFVVVPVAMVITMISGIVIGTPTLRLRGDYLAIVTLGFGEMVRLLADNIDPLRGNRGFQEVGRPPGTYADGSPIFTQTDGKPWYWLTITCIIVVLVLVGNLERSRVGRAWVAIREDEDAAELMGVPTFRFKVWAFVIGAAVGGLSGVLYAGQIGFVNNQRFDVVTSILFVAAVVLGGSGNKLGVLLGALVISYVPDRLQLAPEYRFLFFGLALMVLMVFRPQGLLGARQRLLARGRQAYVRLVGRPEQVGTESALTDSGSGVGS
ncbi:MAG TPA: branched-chain amino acid ABC transporter permease [Actinopolymorphaceae bacterium]|jgi:branched-chain amino acid transport system permease protein